MSTCSRCLWTNSIVTIRISCSEKNRRRALMIEHLEERERKVLEQKEQSVERDMD